MADPHTSASNENKSTVGGGGEEKKDASPAGVCLQSRSSLVLPRPQRIYKVPPLLLADKEHVYHPRVLSLGPYHHGQPQFPRVEEFKTDILNRFVSADKDKAFFCNKILERIDRIRSYYEEGSTAKFNDEALAEMMLRDACFMLCHMEVKSDREYLPLGMSVTSFLYQDFYMLENQIPLWILRLLIGLKYGTNGKAALFSKLLSCMKLRDNGQTRIPWKDANEPPHLLAALRKILLFGPGQHVTELRSSSESMYKIASSSQFRSVMDLKAKGVHFRPSSSCLMDIRFHSNSFYGLLHLPIWYISNNTKVIFSNMIAYEMSAETATNCGVLSSVSFMKTLIENAKDVKELREKGILFSCLESDEEVVKVFKEINTFGMDYLSTFGDVKMRIEEYCSSKAKTWMADLINTYFRSPLPLIALVVGALLLCLEIIQVHYAIHPVKDN
ncbi:hypothetical protein Salat_0968900 [Sesamum alatum]|uniref:Uncharacterized protein n=1 Tax=Sesamum alatum TaxID=300844 RepID=A0AAE1YLA8_9LAMI|nr:hypothetical protein Salat_0968900 [Sesamum alatum]